MTRRLIEKSEIDKAIDRAQMKKSEIDYHNSRQYKFEKLYELVFKDIHYKLRNEVMENIDFTEHFKAGYDTPQDAIVLRIPGFKKIYCTIDYDRPLFTIKGWFDHYDDFRDLDMALLNAKK